MKAIIFGTGSIGKRHLNILKNFGYQCTTATRRNLKDINSEGILINLNKDKNIINNLKNKFDIAVIANDPKFRENDLDIAYSVTRKSSIIAIEKPLISNKLYKKELLIKFINRKIYTLFNVRFHPHIRYIYKNNLVNKDTEYINFIFHDDVERWYGKRYLKNYINDINHGGVLNTSCHEMDLLSYLTKSNLNEWKILKNKQKNKRLQNGLEDQIYIEIENKEIKIRSKISLSLSNYSRKRYLIIKSNSPNGSYKFNLDKFPKDKSWQDTYIDMWQDILTKQTNTNASGHDGMLISKFCSKIKIDNSNYGL